MQATTNLRAYNIMQTNAPAPISPTAQLGLSVLGEEGPTPSALSSHIPNRSTGKTTSFMLWRDQEMLELIEKTSVISII